MKRKARCRARGGIMPVVGNGTATSDSIPVVVAGQQVNLSNGEGAAILPAKTMQNKAAVQAIEEIIEATNGKPPVSSDDDEAGEGMACGGVAGKRKMAAGGVLDPEEEQKRRMTNYVVPTLAPTAQDVYGASPVRTAVDSVPDGGMLRPENRGRLMAGIGQYSSEVGDAVSKENDRRAFVSENGALRQGRSIFGPQPAGITPSGIASPATGVVSDARYSGPAAVAAIDNATIPAAAPAAAAPAKAAPPVATAASPDVVNPLAISQPAPAPRYPDASAAIPSGTGFIRNNATGAVTPVGSPTPPPISPARQGIAYVPSPEAAPAAPSDADLYRKQAQDILLKQDRGVGGGVAARMLMNLAQKGASIDAAQGQVDNTRQAIAGRQRQDAQELQSIDRYRSGTLDISGRTQAAADRARATQEADAEDVRKARDDLLSAYDSGDPQAIAAATRRATVMGILKQDKPEKTPTPYRFHSDPMGNAVRVNEATGATDVLDRATNTWKPVSAIDPAPREPANRKTGQTYQTPSGPMIWRGNGWEPAQAR